MLRNDVLVSGKTIELIDRFIQNPSQAVLFDGKTGLGKSELLQIIAKQLAGGDFAEIHSIGDEAGTIKIDEIKQLKKLLKLQTPDDTKRIILIPDAERMTPEAQNSLLKVLEEPPKATYFLLSTSNKQKILPTIDSRVIKIPVYTPTKSEFVEFLKKDGYTDQEAARQYLLSAGAIKRVVFGNEDDNRVVDVSRTLLSGTVEERILQLDVLLKNESLLVQLPTTLEQMLSVGYRLAQEKNKDIHVWIEKLHAVEEFETELLYGVSKRTALTKLLLSL